MGKAKDNGCLSLVLFCLVVIFAGSQGQDLKMLSKVQAPYIFSRQDGGETKVTGFIRDLTTLLSSFQQQGVQINLMDDSTKSPSAQDTSMLNDLQQGKVDVIGPLQVSYVNSRTVDFTKPFLNTGILPVWNPARFSEDIDGSVFSWLPLPTEIFLILKPFSAGIWFLTIFCFVGVSVFLFAIYRFNPREYPNDTLPRSYDDDFSILGSFLFTFSCLTWQGYSRAPRSISGRILAAFWWIFVVIFLTCYTAKLVFFLNPIPSASKGKDDSNVGPSLRELSEMDGVTFGVVKGSPEFYFFRQSRMKFYEKMFLLMNRDPNNSFVSSIEEGFQRARDGRFVFLTDSLSAEYAKGRQPCNLETVGTPLTSTGVALAVKRGSKIGELLSLDILELRESGDMEKLYRKWWLEMGECPSSRAAAKRGPDSRIRPLLVMEFGGAFILLLIGAVLAAIALLVEILVVRRRKRLQERPVEEPKPEETAMVDAPAEPAKV